MASRKTIGPHSGGARSAPHTPTSSATPPSAEPPADGPAAAVWAALTASPGATVAQVAVAAGTSRAIAGRELAALQASGLAIRTPADAGGRGTAPATWHPVPRARSDPEASAATADVDPPESTGQDADAGAGQSPAVPLSGATDAKSPGETAPDAALADRGDPGQAEGTESPAASPDERTGDSSRTNAPGDCGQSAAGNEVAELLDQLAAAAAETACAVRSGDTSAALTGMEAIYAAAAKGRRTLKATASGRKTRGGSASRPGQLRDLVQAHLAAHPAIEFTPHAIGRVLGRSSGAVANALDRLTALGQAQLTSERPRRYQATATGSASADAA